jgi:hypothetical protein
MLEEERLKKENQKDKGNLIYQAVYQEPTATYLSKEEETSKGFLAEAKEVIAKGVDSVRELIHEVTAPSSEH